MPTNARRAVILTGGGTGGHIFPAIAIARALKLRDPRLEILFVGAEGKLEMTKVPEAGYEIVGLPVRGIQRSLAASNLAVPARLLASLWKARRLIKAFAPSAVVGTGGYASGPVMMIAASLGIPTIIQEQNSYAGLTNRLLASRASRVCVAYEGMERYFPGDRLVHTGNPVRTDILNAGAKREQAIAHFDLDLTKQTLLVLGGSGGARTLNESVLAGIDDLGAAQIQVIWQTGKFYHDHYKRQLAARDARGVRLHDFLGAMDLAYAAADVVLSRAGALSISELCLVQKPAILVPSPNVTADHQTKNAQALVARGAALMVADAEAPSRLIDGARALLLDGARRATLAERIGRLARPRAAEQIADEVERVMRARGSAPARR